MPSRWTAAIPRCRIAVGHRKRLGPPGAAARQPRCQSGAEPQAGRCCATERTHACVTALRSPLSSASSWPASAPSSGCRATSRDRVPGDVDSELVARAASRPTSGVSPGEAAHGMTAHVALPPAARPRRGTRPSCQSGRRDGHQRAGTGRSRRAAATLVRVPGHVQRRNTSPADFAVNGVACNGRTPATPTPTVPATPTMPRRPRRPPPRRHPDPDATVPPTRDCGTRSSATASSPRPGRRPAARGPSHPDCSGTGTASVDSTVAHSGTRSLRSPAPPATATTCSPRPPPTWPGCAVVLRALLRPAHHRAADLAHHVPRDARRGRRQP